MGDEEEDDGGDHVYDEGEHVLRAVDPLQRLIEDKPSAATRSTPSAALKYLPYNPAASTSTAPCSLVCRAASPTGQYPGELRLEQNKRAAGDDQDRERSPGKPMTVRRVVADRR